MLKVVFAQRVGGSGRTTLAICLAAALGNAGRRVLLVSWGRDDRPLFLGAGHPDLAQVPDPPGLSGPAPSDLPGVDYLVWDEGWDGLTDILIRDQRALLSVLAPFTSTYDFAIVDVTSRCMVHQALHVADQLVLPCKVDTRHVRAARELAKEARAGNAQAKITLVLTEVDRLDWLERFSEALGLDQLPAAPLVIRARAGYQQLGLHHILDRPFRVPGLQGSSKTAIREEIDALRACLLPSSDR